MNIGLVAEGTSDFLVLEGVIRAVRTDVDFTRLHPEEAALKVQGGWRSLKAWCEEWGPRLEELRNATLDKYLDALVVHVDCSMADKVGADRPCPPPSATADALELQVLAWLGLPARPEWLVVTTPSKCTEAWVVASLEPSWEKLATIECEPAHRTENVLAARGLLRKRGNVVKKPSGRYAPLVARLVDELPSARRRCTQLERLVSEVVAL